MIASMPGLATVFVAAKINYGAVLPMLIVFGTAMIGVLVEAFAPRAARYAGQVGVALVGLVAALVAVVLGQGHQGSTLAGAVVIDGPALFLQGTILALSVLIFTAANGLVGAMVFSLLATEVPAVRRSQTLNLVYLPLYAAGIIGPIVGAGVSTVAGPDGPFWVGAAVFLVGAVVVLLRVRPNRPADLANPGGVT